MTIVKFKHQGALHANHKQRKFRNFKIIAEADDDEDEDGFNFSDSGCELVTFGNQICNIPYDLYDLSNLKYVLSVESWNSCLNEEERFSLSAYLPDMDHESFLCTMQELLNGDNFLFGSPVETFFQRMKSGFYSLQVTTKRENLRFLEKCKHYNSLKLYHEEMNKKFLDMKETWSECVWSMTVEEKIQKLKKKSNKKPLLLVDLNALPQEDETLDSPLDENVRVNKRLKGKGVVKERPTEMNLLSSFETKKGMPKGVLKIKPRGDLGQVEKLVTIPFPQILRRFDT